MPYGPGTYGGKMNKKSKSKSSKTKNKKKKEKVNNYEFRQNCFILQEQPQGES